MIEEVPSVSCRGQSTIEKEAGREKERDLIIGFGFFPLELNYWDWECWKVR